MMCNEQRVAEPWRKKKTEAIYSGRNHLIDALRLAFCLQIICYHFFSHFLINIDFPNYFTRSYMGDEFFFITSGFYLAEAAYKAEESPFQWNGRQTIKRIKKIAIPYYITWLFCFFGVRLTNTLTGKTNRFFLYDMANSVYELLFLEMLGFKKGLYSNDVAWFFSALLIVCFIIGPWVAKNKKGFSLYAAPIIAAVSYGVLSLNYDYLHNPTKLIADSFIMKGLIRASAAICLGIFLNGIVNCEKVQNYLSTIGSRDRKIIEIADICIWLIVLAYMVYPFRSRSAETWIQFDYIEVFLMTIGLIPVFAGIWEPYLSIKTRRTFLKMGRFAFFAYFGQAVFYSVDKLIFSMETGILCKAIILLCSVFVITEFLAVLTTRIQKLLFKQPNGSQ